MGGRGSSSYADDQGASYRLSHRPGNPIEHPGEVATADRISSGDFFPSDFLNHPEYYFPLDNSGGLESLTVLRGIQGKPNAVVTVYRGVPKGVLNQGDWVSLSKTYANEYAEDAILFLSSGILMGSQTS